MQDTAIRSGSAESWSSRIMVSLVFVLLGFFLAALSAFLLFLNEGCSVNNIKQMDEVSRIVVSIPSPSVDPSNEEKLIHVSGDLKTEDVLRDDQFGIAETGMRLSRNVEMYQVKGEKKSREKCSTSFGKIDRSKCETYEVTEYHNGWFAERQQNSDFSEERDNPPMEFHSIWAKAKNVSLGEFHLSPKLISELGVNKYYVITESSFSRMPANIRSRAVIHEGGIYIILYPLVLYPQVAADVPFLGKLVESGTVKIAGIFSFVTTMLVIAFAWKEVSPDLAAELIAAAAAGIVVLIYLIKQKGHARTV